MRDFVIALSSWSKQQNPDFLIIPQNGQELITQDGNGSGDPVVDYLASIDATGRESMFYGYYEDNEVTPDAEKQHLLDLCLLCESQEVKVLATDYCYSLEKMQHSYSLNQQYGFTSFAADQRELNNIPSYPDTLHLESDGDMESVQEVNNFLYLLNTENYPSKEDFVSAVEETNYDLIIMDFYHDETSYTTEEIARLKFKANGGRRLLIAYMSIGEAEDYRYYWNDDWTGSPPDWMEGENPDWEGNYKVRYWHSGWQDIVFGNADSYLQRILTAGFDGVYLDIIDAFEYFEESEDA